MARILNGVFAFVQKIWDHSHFKIAHINVAKDGANPASIDRPLPLFPILERPVGILVLLRWLVFGLIVGAIARLILPGKQEMGWLMTIVLGIVGSFVGGAISWLVFGGGSDGGINPAGWLMSIVGAFIVVFVYSRVMAKKA
jgi:uncharacterized membrane protein YeaQ/YmgE (transglycosylase-associated protein family)